MGYSYKTYSETKDVMKKYVNATEGAIIYSMSKTHLMTLVNECVSLSEVRQAHLHYGLEAIMEEMVKTSMTRFLSSLM